MLYLTDNKLEWNYIGCEYLSGTKQLFSSLHSEDSRWHPFADLNSIFCLAPCYDVIAMRMESFFTNLQIDTTLMHPRINVCVILHFPIISFLHVVRLVAAHMIFFLVLDVHIFPPCITFLSNCTISPISQSLSLLSTCFAFVACFGHAALSLSLHLSLAFILLKDYRQQLHLIDGWLMEVGGVVMMIMEKLVKWNVLKTIFFPYFCKRGLCLL